MSNRTIAAAVALAAAFGAARLTAQTPPPDGQALYREHCRSCHGANGVPPQRARDQYANIATLSDSAFMASRSDDSVLAVMRLGAGRGRQRGRDMESFRDKMTEPEMRAVIAYVRSMASRRR